LLYLLYFLDTQHASGINMPIFRSLRLCCWTTTLAVLFLDCCVLELGCDSTLAEPHPNSNTQQSKNNTANVVVQQHSRKLLKMDILMPETCWVSKKWSKCNKWHLVGFLFFNYHNDARSNKHQTVIKVLVLTERGYLERGTNYKLLKWSWTWSYLTACGKTCL